MRLQDSYRQKVYNSERSWANSSDATIDNPNSLITIKQAQALCDNLSDHFGVARVPVGLNLRLKRYAAWYKPSTKEIECADKLPQLLTITHEFSHHLDYQRGHDEKGHGGSFVEAHLNVIAFIWGASEASRLRNLLDAKGVPVTKEDSLATIVKSYKGQQRRKDRDGEIGEGWSIKRTLSNGTTVWLPQNKNHWAADPFISQAGFWRRQSTVDKILRGLEEPGWEATLTYARLDTRRSNRWWVIEEVR